jgi:hypothetical protein
LHAIIGNLGVFLEQSRPPDGNYLLTAAAHKKDVVAMENPFPGKRGQTRLTQQHDLFQQSRGNSILEIDLDAVFHLYFGFFLGNDAHRLPLDPRLGTRLQRWHHGIVAAIGVPFFLGTRKKNRLYPTGLE